MDDNLIKTNNNEDKKKKTASAELSKALEGHGQTITALAEYIKGKSNVHGEIRKYIALLGSSFKKIAEYVEKANLKKPSVTSSVREVQTSPSLLRTYSETTVKDSEIDEDSKSETPKIRKVRKAKRKVRSSPEEIRQVPKMRKTEEKDELAKPRSEVKFSSLEEHNGWKEVKKKKTLRKKIAIRPCALIVRPSQKAQYAEILKRVKKDTSADRVSQYVDKIRRTASGDMLLILAKNENDKAQEIKSTISAILGDDATVVSKVPEQDIVIKDLDETTTKPEILEALQKIAGEERQILEDAIKSLRKAYGGTLTASVRIEAGLANTLIERKHVKIGWVNCRIRAIQRPIKCFKCWHFGHLANQCSNKEDRSKSCIRCGELGHKIRDCNKEARCVLCVDSGNIEDCAHSAGCGKCPIFKRAIQMLSKLPK